MKMEKATFKIYGHFENGTHIKDQKGYIFDYADFRFGCHNTGIGWAITEISTGMLIGLYAPRKKDVISLLDEHTDLLEVMRKALKDEKNKAVQEEIRKAYSA